MSTRESQNAHLAKNTKLLAEHSWLLTSVENVSVARLELSMVGLSCGFLEVGYLVANGMTRPDLSHPAAIRA